MDNTSLIRQIDMDYWCNAKKDIVLTLLSHKDVESISQMARMINKSFSVTHKHLTELKQSNIVIFRKISRGKKMLISLKYPLSAEEIFTQ